MPDHPRVGGDRRRFSALLRNFEGNRADGTTLEEILNSVERKHSSLGRVWVFDRGLVSEENLALLRERGVFYFVTQAQG